MRLPLERWDMLTKHANPHDRAWTNDDVRELVVFAMEHKGVVDRVHALVDKAATCVDRPWDYIDSIELAVLSLKETP